MSVEKARPMKNGFWRAAVGPARGVCISTPGRDEHLNPPCDHLFSIKRPGPRLIDVVEPCTLVPSLYFST